MKTRNELLDRLIESMMENQYHLYKSWMRETTLEEWVDSNKYRDSMKIQAEMNELVNEYE